MHPRGGGGSRGGGPRGYSTRCIRSGGTSRLSQLIRPRRAGKVPPVTPEDDQLIGIASVQLSRVNMKCADVKARLIPLLSKQFVSPTAQSTEGSPCLYWINLDLSENNLADDGIATLMEWWSRHIDVLRLRTLRLYRNLVADRGASAIATLVERHPWPLEELHLSHNSITDTGAARLFEAFVRARGSSMSPNSTLPTNGYLYPRYDPNVGLRLPVWMRLEYNLVDDCPQVLACVATAVQDRAANTYVGAISNNSCGGESTDNPTSSSTESSVNRRAPSSGGSSSGLPASGSRAAVPTTAIGPIGTAAVCFAEKLGAPSMKDPNCAPKKCAKASHLDSPLFHLFSFTHQLRRHRSTETGSPTTHTAMAPVDTTDRELESLTTGGPVEHESGIPPAKTTAGAVSIAGGPPTANKRTRVDRNTPMVLSSPTAPTSSVAVPTATAAVDLPATEGLGSRSRESQPREDSPAGVSSDAASPAHTDRGPRSASSREGRPAAGPLHPGTPPGGAVSGVESSHLSFSCPPHQPVQTELPLSIDELAPPSDEPAEALSPMAVVDFNSQLPPHLVDQSDSAPSPTAGPSGAATSQPPHVFCRVYIDGQATVAMAADPRFRNPTSLLSRELCGLSVVDLLGSSPTAAGSGTTSRGGTGSLSHSVSDGPTAASAPNADRTFPALTWRWLADQAVQQSSNRTGQAMRLHHSPAGYESVKIVLPLSAEQEALMGAIPLGIRAQVESSLRSCVDPLRAPHICLLDKPIDIDSSETSLTAEENAVARTQFHLSAFALQTLDTALTAAAKTQHHTTGLAATVPGGGYQATLLVTANAGTLHFFHWLKHSRWSHGNPTPCLPSFAVVPLSTFNEALSQVAQAGGALSGDSVSAAVRAVAGDARPDSRLSLAELLAAAALVAKQKSEVISPLPGAALPAHHIHTAGSFLPTHSLSHPHTPVAPSPLELPMGRKFPPIPRSGHSHGAAQPCVAPPSLREMNRLGRASSDLQAQPRPHLLYGDSQPAFPVSGSNNAPDIIREILQALQRLRSNLLAAQTHQEPPTSSVIRDVEFVTTLSRSLATTIASPSGAAGPPSGSNSHSHTTLGAATENAPPSANASATQSQPPASSARATDLLGGAPGFPARDSFPPTSRSTAAPSSAFQSGFKQSSAVHPTPGSQPKPSGGPPGSTGPPTVPTSVDDATAARSPAPPPAGPPPPTHHSSDLAQLVTQLNQLIQSNPVHDPVGLPPPQSATAASGSLMPGTHSPHAAGAVGPSLSDHGSGAPFGSYDFVAGGSSNGDPRSAYAVFSSPAGMLPGPPPASHSHHHSHQVPHLQSARPFGAVTSARFEFY